MPGMKKMRNFIAKKTAKGHFRVAPSVYELFTKNHVFIAHFDTKIPKNIENKCISTPPPTHTHTQKLLT